VINGGHGWLDVLSHIIQWLSGYWYASMTRSY